MSNRHDVIIWDADIYGAPNDYNSQTLAKAQALIKQPAEASQKLLAFARDVEQQGKSNDIPPVIARYLTNFEARVKAANTAAYCFNLPEYNWHSLVKILLKAAKKHGLALFDEEIVLVLLPNGSITPQHSEKYWLQILDAQKNENAFPETLSEFYQLLKTRAGELLAEHDFILEEDNLVEDDDEFYINYIRKITSGNHQISFGCSGGDGGFQLDNYFQLVEYNMLAIGVQSDFKYSMTGGGGILLHTPNILNPQESWFKVDNWESFEELLVMLKQSVLKWSDIAQDIKGMNALLNGDVDIRVRERVQQFTYTPYALIIARLANNPNFEELAVSLGQFGINGKSWPAGTKTSPVIAWPKLVQYLRQDINLLFNVLNTVSRFSANWKPILIEEKTIASGVRIDNDKVFNISLICQKWNYTSNDLFAIGQDVDPSNINNLERMVGEDGYVYFWLFDNKYRSTSFNSKDKAVESSRTFHGTLKLTWQE